RRARDRSAPRTALAGVMLTVAALIGAVVFGVSMSRLVQEPARYGDNFDFKFGDDGATELPEEAQQAMQQNANFTGLLWYGSTFANVGARTMPIVGFETVRGDTGPVVLSGRLPAAADEIALGRSTAKSFGLSPGRSVTLAGPTGTQTYRVTGLVAVPGL